ncbi:MAG TPA: transcription termination/antitermination NusG family protein [Thermoanaerobaculia bacterium]|nr:transcription termination/antitermination NusG family protein [Thermoanaerobaculia bacterium]
MPILRKESDIYPHDLFSIPVEESPWEIAQVRSRHEKTLARLLLDRQQPFYLPQLEKKVRRAGRTFTSFFPLFSGYVFLRRTPATRQVLWSTEAIARVIRVEDQTLLTKELEQIRSLQERGATLVVLPDLVAGDPVQIKDGVFQGYFGTVLRDRDEQRLVVTITAVNKSVVADLPRESLARVKRDASR